MGAVETKKTTWRPERIFCRERERELRNDAWEEMRVYKCRGGEESRERSREGGGGVRTW
jgi:hypothetical protein